MPSFRPSLVAQDSRLPTLAIVLEYCQSVTRLENFVGAGSARLSTEYVPKEETFWEIFHGRALDKSQTRLRQQFEAWSVSWVEENGAPSAEPIVSVKWDAVAEQLHVTRAIFCHAYESYDAGDQVIETREVCRWQRELVGSVRLKDIGSAGELGDELACLVFQSVVGTSRLPLTSVEAPMPAFSLGQLGYWYCPGRVQSPSAFDDLLQLVREPALAPYERVKAWEFLIRAAAPAELPAIGKSLDEFATTSSRDGLAVRHLFRDLFNGISLTPYTDFVSKALIVLRGWAGLGPPARLQHFAEILAEQIWLIARHLAAYNLVTFHHRGANYPDAILTDEFLRALLSQINDQPSLLSASPSIRRAIRLATCLIAEYKDHLVPDAPTSPGENVRVLPEPFVRIDDEQIYSPITRHRRLFSTEFPRIGDVSASCFDEQDLPGELVQLGTAIYIDRPLGYAKGPGEPDQTLLTSHALFSRSIAQQRILHLSRRCESHPHEETLGRWREALDILPVVGLPLAKADQAVRPGVASLQDAFRLADDWILIQTTRRTIREFAEQYDLRPLFDAYECVIPDASDWRLLIPTPKKSAITLQVYDRHLRFRVEFSADLSQGYRTRGGVEFPAAGLQILRIAKYNDGRAEEWIELQGSALRLPPC